MPKYVFLLLIIATIWGGCMSEPSAEKDSENEFILPDTINDDGLAFVRLGAAILEIDTTGWNVIQIADTITDEAGWLRIQRSFEMEKGQIIVDGEAIDGSSATTESLNKSRIDRIRILGSGYTTPEGIRVGMPIQRLLDYFSADSIDAVAIPGYGRTQISVRGNESFFFLANALPAGDQGSTPFVTDLKALPASATIESIVVM